MKPDFMAELVMVEGLGGFVNSHENIELLDMQLNRDGVVMVLNENSEASFWINDEKLLFTLRNPSGGGQGWSVGDEVTYWTEESKRWGKGVISSLGENMAAVQGGVGGIHEVEYKNLKSPSAAVLQPKALLPTPRYCLPPPTYRPPARGGGPYH